MEYIYLLLITLGVTVICALTLRRPPSADLTRKQMGKKSASPTDNLQRQQALQRKLSHTPTPWGWPSRGANGRVRKIGSLEAQEVRGAGETLHQWVDRLKSRKISRSSEEYKERSRESLRIMLEDGYGRARNPSPIKYNKVKAPLLRNPSAPHDQMDNFPSGKTEEIKEALDRQPRITPSNVVPMRRAQIGGIKDF